MSEPLISIIVPAYNTEKTIKKCVDSLLALNYPCYEVFVVDDGSTDSTREILKGYGEKIRLVEETHDGPSRCRNQAIQLAQGEFIAFTDSDCIVDRNWLKELIRGFIKDRVVSVGGIQLSPEDETDFGKNVQAFFELTGFLGGYIKSPGDDKLKEVPHNPSCNATYRKNALLDIGGFDENLWPSEDVDIDYRLKKQGFVFMFNPKAIVYHYRPQSLKMLSKMMFRYGVMQGILTKRYGFFRRIQFAFFIFIAFLALLFINKNFFWLLLLFYLSVLFKTRNILSSFCIVFLSASSYLVWSVGFLNGLVCRKI